MTTRCSQPTEVLRRIVALFLQDVIERPENRHANDGSHDRPYRTAFYAMTRLLLDRAWEDVGRRCPRAPGAEQQYGWYKPPRAIADQAAELLADVDRVRLDSDVLGPLYEAWLDEHQRRHKGQYYTPPALVRFLWDRLEFATPERMFLREGGRRVPCVIADFSTGSGAFLVEAARRIRETVLDSPDATVEDLRLAVAAIAQGLCGAEIDGFASYLTQVNLLLQLAPILAAMRGCGGDDLDRNLVPSILNTDALRLHYRACSRGFSCLSDGDQEIQEDRLKLGLRTTQRTALQDGGLDFVCSNPPYLGEKGHKELFRRVLRDVPYWNEFYQGKMDYFYWFIILGLSKLRPGGRLGYVTTGYWHTADGGSKLRRYILNHAKIVEMIDFGEVSLFPDAPGQHNMVFVLERSDDEDSRRRHVPKLVQVKANAPLSPGERAGVRGNGGRLRTTACSHPVERFADDNSGGSSIDDFPHPGLLPEEEGDWSLLEHIQSHIDIAPAASYEDDCIRVFWAPVAQGELSEGAWYIFQQDHAQAVLQQLAAAGEPLRRVCEYVQGVVSGADRVTRDHIGHLPPEVVRQHSIRARDGIFVLTADELAGLRLSDSERLLVKRTYKNSQIARYVIDTAADSPEYLLYIARGCGFSPAAFPALFAHLARFKTVLERKRECRLRDPRTGEPRRQWFELHWPRNQRVLGDEKLVTPRRAAENRFAYVNGDWYENSDLAVLAKREGVREGLKYLLALLNSAALDFWYGHRGKRKGRLREYYKTPLEAVPIRRIRFEPATDESTKRTSLDHLRAALDSEQWDEAAVLLRQALRDGQEDVVHDGLEALVDRMIALATALARHSPHLGTRLARLRLDAPLPAPLPAGMLEADKTIAEVQRLRGRMARAQSVIDAVVWDLYRVCTPPVGLRI